MKKNRLRIIVTTVLIAGIMSSGYISKENKSTIENTNQTKKQLAQTKSIEYQTITTYNSSLPKGSVVTKEQGHNGLAYIIEKDETLLIESPKNAEIEIGTGDEAEYIGKMTGYGADCAGCSGALSCKTHNGYSYNLYSNGEYYEDPTYGKVRILAAALDKFPCGTMIEVQNDKLGTFNAIVLDTGGAMKKAWANGTVLMDLAFKSENDTKINNATSNNTRYNVKRWGY